MNEPRPPLKTIWSNQRARIQEHWNLMREARRKHGTRAICPYCYEPQCKCD